MTIGDRHRISVMRLMQCAPLFNSFDCFLQVQQPIALPPQNEPEPDGAVVHGRLDDYRDAPPSAAHVHSVLEVSDSSLNRDLTSKLRNYALATIPQYIVVDLVNDRVLVHEQPTGGAYKRVTSLARGEVLRISAGGGSVVDLAVERLLP